jgi:hypothetical protein
MNFETAWQYRERELQVMIERTRFLIADSLTLRERLKALCSTPSALYWRIPPLSVEAQPDADR